jgi:undecaprenyl diphosphate synthase
LVREGIRLETIGRADHLPNSVQEALNKVKEETKPNSDMTLTLALSYGARSEIIEAVSKMVAQAEQGILREKDIDEKAFSSVLHTRHFPDPDLLIRTSGEMRISNFMLWQIAYTELYFTNVLWPDFKGNNLLEAIIEYQGRERRFGLTHEQVLASKR